MTGECRRGGLDLVINFRSMSIVMTKQQSDDEDVFVICYVGKKERVFWDCVYRHSEWSSI